MPLKAEPEKLEVRKQAEEAAGDDIGEEDLKEAEDGNCKGGRMETDIDEGPEGRHPTIHLPMQKPPCERGMLRRDFRVCGWHEDWG